MKTINLPALSQVTLDDTSSFLLWLERLPAGEVSVNQMERASPIRTSKLSPVIKVLDQFGFICKKEGRIKITMSGKDFCHRQPAEKRTIIRELFLGLEQMKRISDLLKESPSGFLPKKIVHDCFSTNSLLLIAESEINGIIAWAEACELFLYNRKKEIIFLADLGFPRNPTPVAMRLVS